MELCQRLVIFTRISLNIWDTSSGAAIGRCVDQWRVPMQRIASAAYMVAPFGVGDPKCYTVDTRIERMSNELVRRSIILPIPPAPLSLTNASAHSNA